MIDAVRNIGLEFIKEKEKEPGEQFLKCLIRKHRKVKEEPSLMKLIFRLDREEITRDVVEVNDRRLQECYWVGNAEGNRPQNRLTTDKIEYLMDPEDKKRATWNIIQNIEEFWRSEEMPSTVAELRDKLKKIEDKFFGDDQRKEKTREEIERIRSPYKDKIVLCTVSVEENGKLEDLTKTEGYEEFLKRVFLRPHEAVEGLCRVCGEKKKVLPDPGFPGGSILKMYVTDKKGFTSGVADTDEARLRTFSVCPDCLRGLLAGENYIRRNLRDRLGKGFSVYLVPKGIGFKRLDELRKNVRDVFGAVKGFEGLQEFERVLSREYEMLAAENVYLDLIFGAPLQSKFDFKYYIQDVPILRLEMLRRKMSEIGKKAANGEKADEQKLLGGSEEEWNLGFQKICEIFPLRTQRWKIREWKVLLELFSAMLTKTPYFKHLLFNRAKMLARIHRFGVYEPYGMREPSDPDRRLVEDILKYNLLLRLLTDVGCMTENIESASERTQAELKQWYEEIPGEVKQWWNWVGYDEKQKALFLLGYLVGKIGSEQFKKGDKKKAILNRINFDGMPSERIYTLANSVLKSLRDYGILHFNEAIYASMKLMLDRTIEEMKDPTENLFYILSGYSFSTRTTMVRKVKNDGGGSTEE